MRIRLTTLPPRGQLDEFDFRQFRWDLRPAAAFCVDPAVDQPLRCFAPPLRMHAHRRRRNSHARLLRLFATAFTTTHHLFLLIEVGLRSVLRAKLDGPLRRCRYAIGNDQGPVPPWNDALDLLKGDSALIWKNEPSARRTYLDVFSPVRTAQDRIDLLRRFIPTVPEEFRANHTWAVRINSDGYRGEELSVARGPSTVRIACVGDSWTFGMPVGQEQTYPSRVAAWLHQERPDLRYEVQNFGVLGYSSFQGLQLLKSRVLDFHPDVVVIGFGMNDSEVAGYRDKDIVAGTVHPTLISRVKETAGDAASTSKARFLTVAPGPPRVRIQSPSATTSKPKPGQRRRRRLDYDSSAMDARVPARLRVERCEMIRLAGAAPPSC